jgi:UDP-N-acetylglucosamine diphosphorylase/glucosamine-1-phosphate N-acetyltransferase
MNNNLVITIMAAGNGKRMNSNIPKVLHNFNKIPILIRILLQVIKINPKKIIIITGIHDELIKSTIKNYFENNKNNYFSKLLFIQQKNPNGTGDAIKSTLDYYSDDENVLILNGDMPLISFELLNKITYFYEPKLLVSKLDNPYGYGRIICDKYDNFISIKEEKDCNNNEKKINLVNVGIYFLNSILLKKYIPLIDNNNQQKEYYLTDIIKIIKNNSNIEIKKHMIEKEMEYQIYGINTQEELLKLEKLYEDLIV